MIVGFRDRTKGIDDDGEGWAFGWAVRGKILTDCGIDQSKRHQRSSQNRATQTAQVRASQRIEFYKQDKLRKISMKEKIP